MNLRLWLVSGFAAIFTLALISPILLPAAGSGGQARLPLCHPSDSEMTAEIIGAGILDDGGGADSAGLLFVQSRDDLPDLIHALETQTRMAVETTDFVSQAVVILLSGRNSPSTSSIRFLRGFLQGGQLWISAEFQEAGTSPDARRGVAYQALRLNRAQLGEHVPSSWIFLDQQGKIRATAGVPSGGILFDSLAQAAPGGSDPHGPLVQIATSLDEAERFLPLLTTEHQQIVRRNNWEMRAVVGVFLGAVSSSGYSITVQQLRVEQRRLRVTVAVQAPSPDSNVRPAFTTPYHIVSVPKSAFGSSQPSGWILEHADGQVLAREP